ncbi:MAG: hypothetical protein O2809_07535 [Proteobacteria bacterium]|nr:hypothetical protein [Pseudomonadota bacterium]
MSSQKCAEFREASTGLSNCDLYMPNQMAIQIGWLIGYFSHMENKSPEKTNYFDYALPVFSLYREHVFNLMASYAEAVNEATTQSKEDEAEATLKEIHALAEKASAKSPPATTDFQKDIQKAHAHLEETLIGLVSKGFEIKIVLMSTFYFWFTLEAPIHGASEQFMDSTDPFVYMGDIIELVKTTSHSLPPPDLSKDIHALSDALQKLKKHIPNPETLDQVNEEKAHLQANTVNEEIHNAIGILLNRRLHPEAISNALFSHWMRFSVFFGVTEQQWQKMDYYFPEIMKKVREYIQSLIK